MSKSRFRVFMDTAVKETNPQRVERLKREKNPWECCFDEIQRFAREGYSSIPPEWLGTYFRSCGVYTQGDGKGAIGRTGGEGKAVPYFMVRRTKAGAELQRQLNLGRQQEVQRQRAAVEAARKALEDLEEELRRKGLPPGWAR